MLLRVGVLPDEPLAAAAAFYAQILAQAVEKLERGGDLILVFEPACHTHREWRQGVVRGLARQFAPARVNAVAGLDGLAVAAAAEYLACASGVTGQLLSIDGTGAGPVLYQD